MWFTGSVNQAINKSKAEKKLFVVFVGGSDDISAKMEGLYESLAGSLSSLPIVAIKLDSQSENCKLFSQIYPVIVIPSTYFIDLNGVAIEIIGGSIENDSLLLEKINKTVDVFKKNLAEAESNNSSREVDNKPPPNDNLSSNTANIKKDPSPEPTASPVKPSAEANTSGAQSDNSDTSKQQNSPQKPLEEKVERANQLIEAIRLKKAKEEEEKNRADEIERRKGMKAMQEAKRLREDKEALEVVKEREREKREEKIAKERVLAQIAADREERRARQMTFTPSTSNQKSESPNKEDEKPELRQRVHEKARIQFRLPDGSAHNHVFEAKDRLQTVVQYVTSNLNIRSFVLSTTFPRKEFVQQEYNQTLEELSLAPTSVLLVINKSANVSSGSVVSVSIFWQIITYISIPLVMIWNAISGFFGRINATSSEPTGEDTRRPGPKGPNRAFSSRDGNIARIRDPNDDDEDNNTWNGNSTQQM